MAAIGLGVFLVVGATLLLFVESDSTSNEPPAGHYPEVLGSIPAGRLFFPRTFTRSVAASVTESVERVESGVPTDLTVSPPNPKPVIERTYIGVPQVDQTLTRLAHPPRDELATRVGMLALLCTDDSVAPSGPPCNGAEAGSRVPAFVAIGCAPEFITSVDQAYSVVVTALGRHAAWDLAAVVRGGVPGLTEGGYVAALRAATGNVGDLWYLDTDGEIVAVNSGCAGHAWVDTAPVDSANQGVGYLYRSCHGPCATPTPMP